MKSLTRPTCHPARPLYSKGLCKHCYRISNRWTKTGLNWNLAAHRRQLRHQRNLCAGCRRKYLDGSLRVHRRSSQVLCLICRTCSEVLRAARYYDKDNKGKRLAGVARLQKRLEKMYADDYDG